jgi:hypothetical protein
LLHWVLRGEYSSTVNLEQQKKGKSTVASTCPCSCYVKR